MPMTYCGRRKGVNNLILAQSSAAIEPFKVHVQGKASLDVSFLCSNKVIYKAKLTSHP